jgi:hypothetical protein
MRSGLFVFVVAVFLVASASAQEVPIVRIEIEPDVVSVGEPVELRVIVLAPTWFPKPPVYPTFELANAMTLVPPDSSYPTSERVGTETWSGISRSYEIYPLIGATYRLDAKTVSVTWSDPETRLPLTRELPLPAVQFRAVVPKGAEALDPYLAGRALTVTREIEGEIEDLSVGDALVVHYTAELSGLAAVFLPPMFNDPSVEGAAVYAKEPVVENGEPARRVETLTFVLESSGELTLPSVELEWWDTTTNTVEVAVVPTLSLPVSGTLFSVIRTDSATGNAFIWVLLVGFGAGAYLLWRWLPQLRASFQSAAEMRRLTEAYAFSELRRALRTGDARTIHDAMLGWLERLNPELDAREFANDHGHTALQQGIERIIASLYANPSVPFEGDNLESAFVSARKDLLSRRAQATLDSLPELNP